MGNETQNRKAFLKSLIGINKKGIAPENNEVLEENEPDPLFEKYARKAIGNRHYSQQMETAATDGTIQQRVGNITSGLAPYIGLWTKWEVMHLLRRTHFGVKKSVVDTFLTYDTNTAVNNLLNAPAPTAPSAKPLNYYQNLLTGTVDSIPYGSTWTANKIQNQINNNGGQIDYYRWLQTLVRK
jgi:hypothetical protein